MGEDIDTEEYDFRRCLACDNTWDQKVFGGCRVLDISTPGSHATLSISDLYNSPLAIILSRQHPLTRSFSSNAAFGRDFFSTSLRY